MRKRSLLTIMALSLSLCLFVGAQAGAQAEEQKYCPLCSMNLKMFWRTNHWLTFSDGTRTGYCSLHCAALVYKQRAPEIDCWEVVDYQTKTLIDAHTAHFLIGSDLSGTMTAVSKLAFASLDVARNYQKDHGGTIGTFDDALKRTLEGLGEDMAMIKKKMAKMSAMGEKMAAKHGCYKCHGQGGKGGKAIGWNTVEFAQKMGDRVEIKEAILSGTKGMNGYEGKISEKELHAIALYIWSQRAR